MCCSTRTCRQRSSLLLLLATPAYESAIVVADALVWASADNLLVQALPDVRDACEYLARALIFRALTHW